MDGNGWGKPVEGLEHGWCELATGRIIDPTIIFLMEPDQYVSSFAGVRRSQEETRALEGKGFPQVHFDGEHGEDGLGHAHYRAANPAAVRKAQRLASRSQPPKEVVGEPA